MSVSESAEKEESRRNGGKNNYRKVYKLENVSTILNFLTFKVKAGKVFRKRKEIQKEESA